MGFINMVIKHWGDEMEYLDPLVLVAGSRAMGRTAVQEERWVKFDAVVSEPVMTRDQMVQSKLNDSVIEFHCEHNFGLTTVVRYMGRRYGLISSQPAEHSGDVIWRYIAQAEIEQ